MENITFNFDKFDIKLETNYIGRNFIFCEEIESTNSYLIENSDKIDENGTLVFAEKQTKGKGRLGRTWVSAEGLNLTFSILLKKIKLKVNQLGLLNLATSLALSNSIENLYQLKCKLKWPNDVLINNKKVAGILIETSFINERISKIIIGIGINVNQTSFPDKFNVPPTSLKYELCQMIEREKLLAEILNNYEALLAKLESSKNEIIKEWKKNCSMIGEMINLDQNGTIKRGVFVDIDECGQMILKTKDELEIINFGEVTII